MRWWVVAVAVLVGLTSTVACGVEDPPEAASDVTAGPEPTAEATTTQGADAEPLVAERRPISEAEEDRIDDDGEGGVLDCADVGASTWDYGPIGPDDAHDRQPQDALRDAIEELNRDLQEGGAEALPYVGWIGLERGSDDIEFLLLDDDGGWRALVSVAGAASLGVWRHTEALLCP